MTGDLRRRFEEHNKGRVDSTKNKLSAKIILYEAYLLKSDARRREKYLKTTEGKHFLKQQIRDTLKDQNML